MIDISDNERRRAFSVWLRTGRLPSLRNADGIELKFNPWHDPRTGRFTFSGAGWRYGQESGGPTVSARQSRPKSRNAAGHIPHTRAPHADAARAAPPSGGTASHKPQAADPSSRHRWVGGGFPGGGGGSFGGAGATGTWGALGPQHVPASHRSTVTAAPSAHAAGANEALAGPASFSGEQFRTAVRNGYTYQIDSRERTRRVSGALTFADVPVRSQILQSRAGGSDRRASDDGGHYIAARFNGPAEAFNHFAQDANFNRGRFRVLEDEWARNMRAGRAVTVKIVPRFDGDSSRPSMIDVSWTVDGKEKSLKFPNERSERSRGE